MASYENWINRRKGKYTGELFKLDTENKSPEQNIVEIIQGLYLRKPAHNEVSPTSKAGPLEIKSGLRGVPRSTSDSGRLSYLNALVTLLSKEDRSNLGFTVDDLMTCIRISLVDDSMVIRAAALRVLRYLIKTESDVATFNTLKLPYLVIRSMDLMLRNEEERAQALRVVRRVIAVVGGTGQSRRRHRAAYVDHGLLRCLAAVARAGSAGDGSGDRLARPAIATLAEIGVLNPELFIACGGVNAVTRQLAECATPRMAEALCGVLLHTVSNPAARIDLTCLSAPYCDFHTRAVASDSNRDEREMRFTCSRLALLCVLRSWPGLLHFCHPKNAGGLKALVQALYLPRLEVRKAILDLLYELVGLPQPEWTDEISVALDAVDPSDFQDSWRLNDGFVAAEGISILPHLSATGPDITEIHLALLLQCFLEAGLLDGLAEVIVTSDTFISVRATVLLGQLLHLLHLLLPPQICSVTPALPSLMWQASAGKPQALAAVAALRRLHAMLEARPATNSLFLDHIIQYCSGAFREKEDYTKSRKEKDNANMTKPHSSTLHKENSIEFLNESDNEGEPKQRHSVGSRADLPARNLGALVKSNSFSSKTGAAFGKMTKSAKFFGCTLVMQNKDGNSWNWEIIKTILKENDSTPLLNLNDSGHKAWVGRIVNYLKPSSNKYSHTDLTSTCHGHAATRAGCQLIRHLLRHNDVDSQRLLEELFVDVSRQIEAIETGLKAHECLFSPQHMCTTMCQMYFLFIGQLCHSQTGLKLFKQTRLYENLLELSAKTHHSCYVKLVISSLDYTLDSYPRDILAKTLTCSIQASRLYATQFLNVLLRASRKSREMVRRKTKLKKNLADMKPQKLHVESNGVDMETWILQMLVGQVKDECRAVVKCALSTLEEAFSVPALVDKMLPLKDTLCQNCRLDKNAKPVALDFAAVGDRGYLLWLGLEVASAGPTPDAKTTAFLKKHLDFWMKNYNYRYVRLVEAGAQEALALCGGAGRRGRSRRAARPPRHLLAARLPPALLQPALPPLYQILQRKKCSNEQEIMDLKASLWAVGNTAVSSQGLQQLMNLTNGYLEESVPVHVVRLAKFSPVYSVRATAFYVLSLIGSTYEGANLLADLGWLCVRHTRHDTFPVIPDEAYLDANLHGYIASPDRRYNPSDAEASEHSDLTDHSLLDSLHSDYTRPNKTESISEDKDQDVVDHKTNNVNVPENKKEIDKKKSHTLPTQGCSTSHDRPTLSESRTVDILRDCSVYERQVPHSRDCSVYERQVPHSRENRLLVGRMNSIEHAHEGRVRNTSESSTSGVSSCDSFLGRYAIPDRVTLTLSPIPSSSSLYGMKSTSSSQRPRISDIQRRTSTSSFTTQDVVASSPPSQLDMTGYDTLKSLNRHRRPHLSESAATGTSELDDICWLLTDTSRRARPFSSLRDRAKSTRERMTKLSLLDYDWKPLGGREARGGAMGGARGGPAPPPAHRPPAYIGICLPQDLSDLFPREEDSKQGEGGDQEAGKRGRAPSFLADCSVASADNRSRATPDSQRLASYRSGDVTRAAANFITSRMAAGPSMITGRTASFTATVKEAANFASDGGTAIFNTSTTNITGTSKNSDAGDSNASEKASSRSKSHNMAAADTLSNPSLDNAPIERKSETKPVTKTAPDAIDGTMKDLKANTTTSTTSELTESAAASETGTSSTAASGVKTNASDTSADAKVGAGAVSDTGTNSTVASKTNASASETGSAAVRGASETGEAGAGWRHARAHCLACVPTRPPSAHELREAFFAGIECSIERRNEPVPVPENSPQAEVMHHAHFMANPIHLRQTRAALLSLKQRHPEVFRSACVYSDVCGLLSRDTYMLCARRFLQELFLDANFECFAAEPTAAVARHSAAAPAPAPTPLSPPPAPATS